MVVDAVVVVQNVICPVTTGLEFWDTLTLPMAPLQRSPDDAWTVFPRQLFGTVGITHDPVTVRYGEDIVTGLVTPDRLPPLYFTLQPPVEASTWKLLAGEHNGAPFRVPVIVTLSPCLQHEPEQDIDGALKTHGRVVVVVEVVDVVVVVPVVVGHDGSFGVRLTPMVYVPL